MLHLTKTKKTKRKFYDKWCYKVSLYMHGGVIFRMAPLDQVEKWLEKEPCYRYLQEAVHNKDNILSLVETLSSYDKSLWQIRIEQSQLDVYTNDVDLYEIITNKFLHIVRIRFEPSNDIPLIGGNIIKIKKLPHDRYRFKVYLKPHKLFKDHDAKHHYIQWIESQSPRISITNSVKRWFLVTEWNWDRRYIWVEDEATLLMLKLRNSEVCGKVHEYQLCDKY